MGWYLEWQIEVVRTPAKIRHIMTLCIRGEFARTATTQVFGGELVSGRVRRAEEDRSVADRI